MMIAERLPDGRLRIPRPAEGPDGVIGDGVDVVAPGDPLYDAWDAYLRLDEGDPA